MYKILFVDDEKDTLEIIKRKIFKKDSKLFFATSACEKFSNINLNEEFLHKLKDLNLNLRKENENFSEELSKSKVYIHTMNDFLIKYIGETLNLTSHIKTYLDKPDEEIISKLFAEIHHLESFSQSIITSLKNGEKHDK